MKSIDSIPTSKIQRAGKIVSTGAKVGVNYLKYYGEKIIKTEAEAKENLNQTYKNNPISVREWSKLPFKVKEQYLVVRKGKKIFEDISNDTFN